MRTAEDESASWVTYRQPFVKKKHVFWGMAFILLYRFAEGQAQKIFPLFFRADREHGGKISCPSANR